MNDFATKREKPTAREYLDESLDQVVERLNNNPNGFQSEAALIQAVITVRAAKISERLANRLNWLTALLIVATVCLAVVPFLIPSIEKKQLEAQLGAQARLIEVQTDQILQLAHTVSNLTEEQNKLAAQVQNYNSLRPLQRRIVQFAAAAVPYHTPACYQLPRIFFIQEICR